MRHFSVFNRFKPVPGLHRFPRHHHTRNGNSNRIPLSPVLVLVDRVAVHSTLVVSCEPSVFVIVSQNSFQRVCEVVPYVTSVGKWKLSVPPEVEVTEHNQPNGQSVVPVG